MSEIDQLLNYIIQNQDKLIRDSGLQDESPYNNRLKNNNKNLIDEMPCDEESFAGWLIPSDDASLIVNPSDPSIIPSENTDEVPDHIKEMNIQIILDSLIESGKIIEYEVDGETYYKLNK